MLKKSESFVRFWIPNTDVCYNLNLNGSSYGRAVLLFPENVMHAELKNNDLQSIKNTVFGAKTGKREYFPPLNISSLNAGLTKK